MSKIIPAILVNSVSDFRANLRIVRQLTNRFQLDLIDDGFAPNATVAADQLDLPRDLQIDIDLMSSDPARVLPAVYRHKPKLIIFHFYEGIDLIPLIEKTKAKNIDVGLALEPDAPLDVLTPFIDKIDLLQLMGHQSGFAKLPFDNSVLTRAQQIKAQNPNLTLAIDGGVDLTIMPKLVEAGFDIIYVNSYIFESDNPLVQYTNLLEKA